MLNNTDVMKIGHSQNEREKIAKKVSNKKDSKKIEAKHLLIHHHVKKIPANGKGGKKCNNSQKVTKERRKKPKGWIMKK